MTERLSDHEFSDMMAVFMEADPWPYSVGRDNIENLLNSEARERGFCDWIEALHKFTVPT